MNTASSKVIELIKARLSEGAEFISVKSVDLKHSVITVIKDGNTLKVPMEKVSTLDHISDRIIEITVSEGTKVDDAIERLSDQYSMYFLPGVDYPSDVTPIRFNGLDSVTYRITLNEACVSMYGSLEVVFRNHATCLRCKGVQTFNTSKSKLRLALACKLFTTADIIVIGGGGIGFDLATKISEYTKTIPNIEPLETGLLLAVEVVDIFNDALSDIVIIQLPNNDQHFIRYRFIQEKVIIVPKKPTMTL